MDCNNPQELGLGDLLRRYSIYGTNRDKMITPYL